MTDNPKPPSSSPPPAAPRPRPDTMTKVGKSEKGPRETR
jgi:hypothetical protein